MHFFLFVSLYCPFASANEKNDSLALKSISIESAQKLSGVRYDKCNNYTQAYKIGEEIIVFEGKNNIHAIGKGQPDRTKLSLENKKNTLASERKKLFNEWLYGKNNKKDVCVKMARSYEETLNILLEEGDTEEIGFLPLSIIAFTKNAMEISDVDYTDIIKEDTLIFCINKYIELTKESIYNKQYQNDDPSSWCYLSKYFDELSELVYNGTNKQIEEFQEIETWYKNNITRS